MALIGEMQYLTIGGNTYSLPSGGGGSVTSVAVSNATNGGLSVSGSPISSSGTITIGHSNVLSSAQTTQAVYPIKIDKNGHISAYGSAVTIPTVNNATLTIQKNGTTVNSFTANASSNVTANITVPTKVSELTNDSGYITNAGVTGVKGNSESSYRTGQVNLTAANIGAIPSNSNGNTQNLLRPLQLNGLADVTLDAKINTLRANRLAFLPADQIIIEKTTDGGSTWTDAGVADSTKVGLFSETRAGVSIPLLNGVKNIKCGLRITITGMKYNVPSGTAETSKYNYWNSNYIVSTERYNQLKEMYFWVSANSDTISVKVERATGAASTTWNTIFDNSSYGMTGWSGNDYIRFAQGVFGGGTNQTSNYWNYRLTFFTRGPGGSTTLSGTNTTSAQVIQEIRGYGDTWWTAGNEYAANDKIYTHDYLKNVTFPAKVTASGGFSGALTGNVTGNISGTAANVTGTVAIANGGTGQTTAANAINALLNGLPVWTADPTDTTYFVRQDTAGTASYGKVAFSTIWNYISGKLPAWSKASTKPTYTASEVGALASNTTYVSTVTTTAGTHSAISSKSGAVSFNVPTKTSHLTNDSGFLTSHQDISGKIDTAGTGLSKSGTTLNHSNSVTAQTTQAVYPIKIDAQGHISAYGSAQTILSIGTTSSTAAAGNHTHDIGLGSTTDTTSGVTLASATKYKLTAGGKSVYFTMPTIPTVSYPVTSVNSKTGAVSLTASDVGALASSTTYVSTVTTTAGTHSAISSKSGAVSFNVPTKTSHLTNDSGFITASHTSTYSLPLAASGTRGGVQIGYSESGTNYAVKLSSEKMYVTVPWTDTKVTTAALTSSTTYYPILATGTGTATRQIDSTLGGLKYVSTAGTTSAVGTATLNLGNTTASGTANNEKGVLRLYGTGATYYTDLVSGTPTANRTITFPNATGTVALTSDIPTVPSNIVNTITTTAGAHTAISSKSGAVSFNVPTTAAHVGAATSDHTHGNITNGGDITATAPTIASGDQIIINDNSASKITNGPTFDGSTTTTALTPKGTWETFSNSLLYGECTIAAATAAKTVTVDSSFKLETGATVAVKFSNANTATSPTLNVNGTGAKGIVRNGSIAAGVTAYTSWTAGETVPFLYNGTSWAIMNNMAQDNKVTQTHSTSDTSYNIALANYNSSSGGTSTLNHSIKIKGNPSTGRIITSDLSDDDIDTFVSLLNYSQINAVDYVVEEGTSGNWKYRKWDSGIAECWLPAWNPGTYTCGTARSSLYSGANLTLTFPITFISTPTTTGNVSLGTDAYVVWLQFNGLGTTTAQVRIVGSASIAANSNYLISVYAIGEWK